MKKAFLLFSLLLLAFTLHAQAIEVGTYNIRCDNTDDALEGNGWQQRCPHVCELINFEAPLVLGTQEVLHNQLVDMQRLLPDYATLGVGRDDGKQAGEYSAIFYQKNRLKVLRNGHFWLSQTPDMPSKGWDAACVRICTWAQFKDKTTGRKFWFFNLHMDHMGVVARRESAKLVISKIKSMTKKNDLVILTGDFNVDQNDEIYQIFAQSGILNDSYAFAQTKMANVNTYNAFRQDRTSNSRIDHIFVSPNIAVQHYAILTESYWSGNERKNPSDHYPVMVKIKL